VADEVEELAEAAWRYGYPLVENLRQIERYVTTGVGANPATTFNAFSHAEHLATPHDTFVSINNDTVYSMGPIDLGVGPVTLEVPDTGGAYYVLQFIDAWTNNFAYVGTRATGTGAGRFLLTPPGWDGDVEDGATQIRFPTRIGVIVGRWACDGPDDLPRVRSLQQATTLTPRRVRRRPPAFPGSIRASRSSCASGSSCGCGWRRSRLPPATSSGSRVSLRWA
jgi:hypothetical protein